MGYGKSKDERNTDTKGHRHMETGKIKVTEAAAILHVSQQYVRIGLQRGVLPIGTAIKMSSKWTYNISPKLLADYSGADIGEELERIRGDT